MLMTSLRAMAIIEVDGQRYRYNDWTSQAVRPKRLDGCIDLFCSHCRQRTWLPAYTPGSVVREVVAEHCAVHVVDHAEFIVWKASRS